MTAYEGEMRRAEITPTFRDMMVDHLDLLIMYHKEYTDAKLRLNYDEDLFTCFVSELLEITRQLLPKLEGGGKRTERLFKEFCEFKTWLKDPLIPKVQQEERERVERLYDLITEAYHVLGLSPL